jgi:hypothetical protein
VGRGARRTSGLCEPVFRSGLALIYQEKTAEGEVSNVNKLVSRTHRELSAAEEKPKTRGAR